MRREKRVSGSVCKGPVTLPPRTRNEKNIVQSKISSSPSLFLGTRKLDDFQYRKISVSVSYRKISVSNYQSIAILVGIEYRTPP